LSLAVAGVGFVLRHAFRFWLRRKLHPTTYSAAVINPVGQVTKAAIAPRIFRQILMVVGEAARISVVTAPVASGELDLVGVARGLGEVL
jgi:hypothetical protein